MTDIADDALLGEIRMFAGTTLPGDAGKWALCNGQLLPINENEALYSLLSNNYGGDGLTNFALPNLQGRVPMGAGGTVAMGQYNGAEALSLTADHLPPHTHQFLVAGATQQNNSTTPRQSFIGTDNNAFIEANATTPMVPMAANSIANEGRGISINLVQPSVVINYMICLTGIYPRKQ